MEYRSLGSLVRSGIARVNDWVIYANRWIVGVQMVAAVYYYIVAGFLIFGPMDVQRTTPIFNLAFGIREVLPFWAHHDIIGAMVLLAAICTSISIAKNSKITWGWRIGLLVPQMYFLLLTVAGEVQMITRESYADGTLRPWVFIAADQVLVIILGILFWLSFLHFVYSRFITNSLPPKKQ